MTNQPCAAQVHPTTRAWRFRRFFVVRYHAVGWFLKLLFLRLCYRHIMRLSHYFGWHYAPIKPGPDGESHRWCHWCGLRGRASYPEIISTGEKRSPDISMLGGNDGH